MLLFSNSFFVNSVTVIFIRNIFGINFKRMAVNYFSKKLLLDLWQGCEYVFA